MMTLEEAIQHAEQKSLEQCGECSEEHKQLAMWLKDLQSLMKNGYGSFTNHLNRHLHDYAIASLQGRLAANPNISSEEVAKLVAKDVECVMVELKSKYPYKRPRD